MSTLAEEARKRAKSIRDRTMRDQVAHPICEVCAFEYPPIMHLHHLYPISETDVPVDQLVWLCPNCHAMAHEIRRVNYGKRRPSNYRVRKLHLDYWLSEICDREVALKLVGLVEKTIKGKQ